MWYHYCRLPCYVRQSFGYDEFALTIYCISCHSDTIRIPFHLLILFFRKRDKITSNMIWIGSLCWKFLIKASKPACCNKNVDSAAFDFKCGTPLNNISSGFLCTKFLIVWNLERVYEGLFMTVQKSVEPNIKYFDGKCARDRAQWNGLNYCPMITWIQSELWCSSSLTNKGTYVGLGSSMINNNIIGTYWSIHIGNSGERLLQLIWRDTVQSSGH